MYTPRKIISLTASGLAILPSESLDFCHCSSVNGAPDNNRESLIFKKLYDLIDSFFHLIYIL